MNKNQFKEWLKQFNCSCSYSGNKRTMYVHGYILDCQRVEVQENHMDLGLRFKIAYQFKH